MASNNKTPRARALGNALREVRQENGIKLRDFAADIGKDPGQLSRWENGERSPKPTDVAQMLTLLRVTGERYDEIIGLANGTGAPTWLAVSLPEQRQQLAAMLNFERTATAITEVAPLLMPGLLQTYGYARAMMSDAHIPGDEAETRVAVRLGRRDILVSPNPAKFVVLIGEAALRQIIGNRAVMAEQLRYLLDMARRDNVDLRVLPFSVGWHPALEGAFLLIDSEQSAVVQLENRRSGLFLHEPQDVDTYREALDTLQAAALSPNRSAKFITEVLHEMEAAA